MLKKISMRRANAVLVGAGMLFLAGCAAIAPAKPEDAVAQRAKAFWDARSAGRADKAYALVTPSYRKVRSLEQFQRSFGCTFTVKDVTVVKVTCEVERCVARTRIDVNPALLGVNVGTVSTHVDEIWLLEDGKWWRHQDL